MGLWGRGPRTAWWQWTYGLDSSTNDTGGTPILSHPFIYERRSTYSSLRPPCPLCFPFVVGGAMFARERAGRVGWANVICHASHTHRFGRGGRCWSLPSTGVEAVASSTSPLFLKRTVRLISGSITRGTGRTTGGRTVTNSEIASVSSRRNAPQKLGHDVLRINASF